MVSVFPFLYRTISPVSNRFPVKCLPVVLENLSIMSSRSRKRVAVKEEEPVVTTSQRPARSRRAVKIEVEDDGEERGAAVIKDEVESPYFKKELSPSQEGSQKGASGKIEAGSVRSPGKKPKAEPIKVEPPENWEEILENIRTMRSTKTAAVDTMGCERTADLKEEPKVQRFQTLISLMLSSQTRDQVTYAAMERLKERGLTVQSMLDIEESDLATILKPVSFYSRKASYIKRTCVMLREQYEDDIPRTVDDLCSLPGVGQKMAYIAMHAAWNENAGIGVDTHVHRISNRLKWTGIKGTATPEKTREALESWMPRDLWQEVNVMLVGFGQETCLPIGPKCDTCLNKNICPSAKALKPKKKQDKKAL